MGRTAVPSASSPCSLRLSLIHSRAQVFDIPSLAHLPFEARLAHLDTLFSSAVLAAPGSSRSVAPTSSRPPAPDPENNKGKKVCSEYTWAKGSIVELVEQKKCEGMEHLIECLKVVEAGGGEGCARFLLRSKRGPR